MFSDDPKDKQNQEDLEPKLIITSETRAISNPKTSKLLVKENSNLAIYVGKPKEEVCEELIAKPPEIPVSEQRNTDKIYFRLISISAIKINLTLRLEKRALNFDFSKGFGALTVVYTLLSSIINISDAPLSFKQLLLKNVCHTQDEITDKIIKNIRNQSIWQFYKLMGSSDIIGNPVGFVSKLGSGVFEFISEPTKGLLKSPKEFGKGLYKGSKAFTTGLISASFDSTSKITGSVYSILKNVSGQEIVFQRNPDT